MNAHSVDMPAKDEVGTNEKLLFWACFMSIVATAFGFIVRTQIMGEWASQFNLSETQKGQILGVGLWPFAISIVLFSLIIDRIGYGKAMMFAFACHIGSAIMTIVTPMVAGNDAKMGYWWLYISTFIVALGNGTVEAVANPVVATLFPRQKTKYLNMLHAGWPGGLVLGGIIALLMGNVRWEYKVALIFLPVIAYGVMMLGRTFPVNERVAAGVSYRSMLSEVGIIGAGMIVGLIVREVGTDFGWPTWLQVGIWAAIVVAYGVYVRFSLGQPMFIFLMLVMLPLATAELGTDSWIGPLMDPVMAQLKLSGGWVLVYTSLIMLILRFFAGPIVHKLSPLGLLCISAAVAACGLAFLSKADGLAVLAAATLYGVGKTFFWPTMLGVVSEQFPRGGALTLNTIAGLGMLSVGVVGAPFLGYIQDSKIDRDLLASNPAMYSKLVGETKESVFGEYKPLDPKKVEQLTGEPKAEVTKIQDVAKRNVLLVVATFPCIMLAAYIGLILYFKSQGGYRAKELISEKEEEAIMTGGAAGAVEY